VGQQVTVARVGEIPDGGSRVVEINQKDVAIFHIQGKYYAIDDLCPHAQASLSGGSVEDETVTCPWHYWRFRLTDGAWIDNPKIKTGCYTVTVQADSVVLEIPDK
jgi:nitrite reductase (NADH) small subunit